MTGITIITTRDPATWQALVKRWDDSAGWVEVWRGEDGREAVVVAEKMRGER